MNISPPKNRTVVDFKESSSRSIYEQDRTTKVNMEYGELIDYNADSGRVRIARLDGRVVSGRNKEELWFPVITSKDAIDTLHGDMMWRSEEEGGSKRGFLARYHWIGSGEDIVSLVGAEILGKFPIRKRNEGGLFAQGGSQKPDTSFDASSLAV